ncbi:MAG: von Willebrand factor type A domain-containing protein [Oscillospiraceae bacterium]
MKTTFKKNLAFVFSVIFTAAAFSACGSSMESDTAIMDNGANAIQKNGSYYTTAAAAEAADGAIFEEVEFNTEEYNSITENSYKSTASDPLSTFSIDVDTACYTNLRRMINDSFEYGYDLTIPQDSIRIEEILNYFSYDYPQPNEGEPFSVTTEIADCPWNDETKLMRIGLHSKDIDLSERPAMNLVFLIDVSGSMFSEEKLPLVQKSFSMLTENLTAKDRVSIVTYAGTDSVVIDGADGNDKQAILDAIASLEAGGSTAGADGINTAYKIAAKHFIEGGNNRIILATDGDLNVGISSESELTKLVEEKRESGVYLSVLGFGTGNYKDNKMEALADNGNGNYSYIDSEREAKRVLVEEMSGTLFTAAKDVKIQVEFNPAYIKGYRLIGYENRALANEDFEDDTKDSGEIGAGHSVTALYELVFNDSPMEFSSADLKYQDEAKGIENGEFLTTSIRYKEPDGNESKLLVYPVTEANVDSAEMSPDMNFAAAAAEFGLVLRDSEYKGTASFDSILTLLDSYDYYDDEYKTEFRELVKKAQYLIR